MSDYARVAHWLRPNHAARMPRRVVTLDSEAYRTFNGLREEQTFRLAVTSFDRLDEDCVPETETDWFSSESSADLWQWIADKAIASRRTVVFAHHLSYDLRLTQALTYLPALGFKVKQMAVSDYGCWVFLRDGKRSIYLVDSLSHIPKSLEKIAEAYNMHKLDLPAEDADNDEWYRRCYKDVQLLRSAVLELLTLYRKHDLGDFRTTGAAQSSAAFRHRFLQPRSILIHADTNALAMERKACWAGRAEIWRHGEVNEPLTEYDFHAAYAHIARDVEIPTRLVGEYFLSDRAAELRLRENYKLLCEVDVTVTEPTLAVDYQDRIIWPTGTFRTVAWDAELDLTRIYGGQVQIRRCFAYEHSPALHDWAVWILDSLHGKELGTTPLGAIIAKEWSRSLIGRFGLRYPLLKFQGTVPYADLLLQPVHDTIEDRDYMQLHVGNELYEQTERLESPNSAPQIMGYIMAYCRVMLWEAMNAAGFDNVFSVDTDGLIVNAAGAAKLATYADSITGAPLRVKGSYRTAEFRGPRNLDLDQDRRVNGVPRRAERVSDGLYRGEVWESLPTALRRRNPQSLLVHERTFAVGSLDPRRLHLPNGQTAAHLLDAAPEYDGRNHTGNAVVVRHALRNRTA